MTAGKLLAVLAAALLLVSGIGASVVGAFALAVGTFGADGDGPPRCEGKVMRPGDQCLVTVNGRRGQAGYEEMARRQEDARREWVTIGGITLGGGVVLLFGGRQLGRWGARGV
ncbi:MULTISPECIES: hypothetical protein [Streptomyces]|uniref:hypothetical protein n=1 Tax=Streptomyces TaxID=1883 RepID=UPI00186B4169|nr:MULTISPECIES: hypothetical protein [Streptomyces]